MTDEKKKLVQTIEEYEEENHSLIAIVQNAKEKIRQTNLFPDLWPVHNKSLHDDVSSKVASLQIPRALELLTAIEAQLMKESKARIKDIN